MKKYLTTIGFAILGVVWGSNFIYMKSAVTVLTPTQIVFCRVLFGFIPVLIYALSTKVLSWKHFKYSHHFLIMSLLGMTLYYYAYVRGTTLLLSSIAGVLSGAAPIATFVLGGILLNDEKISKQKIIGISVATIGILIIGSATSKELFASNLEGVLFMLIGAFSFGASFIYAKKFINPLKISPVALSAYQLFFGVTTLLLVTDFNGVSSIASKTSVLLGVIIGLGVLGTGLTYIIYYYIVDKLGAVIASSVTYLPPIVALFIGAVLIQEPIQAKDYIATILIFLGVYLIKRNK